VSWNFPRYQPIGNSRRRALLPLKDASRTVSRDRNLRKFKKSLSTRCFVFEPLIKFVSIITKKQMSRKINQRRKRILALWHIKTTSNVKIIQSSFKISPRQKLIPLQFYLLAHFLHTWEQALPLTFSLNNVPNQSQTIINMSSNFVL